jgi:glyoxylase-like metal-dependent hydrolase (beta-lactamase superfamily II)
VSFDQRSLRQEARPASTEVAEVAPGVLRMQLPISMPGLGHVNCYALEDERGLAVVDPGMPGPATWRALTDRLRQVGAAPRAVHTVIVTHSHPDHRATATAGRATVEAVTQQVFHPRAWGHMAESETYAHLEHLRHQGRVAVDDRGPDLVYEVTT